MTTTLTAYELGLVTDAGILLAKNNIIQKVYLLFGRLAEVYQNESGGILIPSGNLAHPKIARGENYLGLPYVMLDFPRKFSKDGVFAIRTFFWWGNFFSITLQLSGNYQELYSSQLQQAFNEKLFEGWFIGISEDPWLHHFEKDNYRMIDKKDSVIVGDFPFIKAAKKIPLMQWEVAREFFIENFKFLMKVLKA